MHTYLCLAGLSSLLDECKNQSKMNNSTNLSIAAGQLIDVLQQLDPSLNLRSKRTENLNLTIESAQVELLNLNL